MALGADRTGKDKAECQEETASASESDYKVLLPPQAFSETRDIFLSETEKATLVQHNTFLKRLSLVLSMRDRKLLSWHVIISHLLC